MKQLGEGDYEKDEKQRSVVLTEEGTEKAERLLEEAGLIEGANLYDIANTQVVHHLNQALKANTMFRRDIDYIVKDGKVVIIDEFTGRMMDGRRWSDGLHQAVEAKEGVNIEPENQTLASITFQNYFRMYPKLSGMTGTALTEAPEFFDIYKMNVVTIPTHKAVSRVDEEDEFYKNINDKFAAIAKSLKEKQELGQPVLVGTVSIEKSELLSEYLNKEGVEHAVLNARFHESEAHIVAQAGPPRQGDHRHQHGRPRHRHSAGRQRRVPVRGRTQGHARRARARGRRSPDPRRGRRPSANACAKWAGCSCSAPSATKAAASTTSCAVVRAVRAIRACRRFYLSLDDDLLRIFGPQTAFARLMEKNLEDGEAIVSPWISKAIETAQKKVEARNYDIRKQVVEFDDVMNDQRKVIYEQRAEIMDAEHVSDVVTDMRADTVDSLVTAHCPPGTYPEQWDLDGLKESLDDVLGLQPPIDEWFKEDGVDQDLLIERIGGLADEAMITKTSEVEPERWQEVEKTVLIQTLDHHWKEHLATLDALRQVIHLRSYAQKKPIDEYKSEAFAAVRAPAGRDPRGRHQDPDARPDRDGAAAAARAAGVPDPASRSAVGPRRYRRSRCGGARAGQRLRPRHQHPAAAIFPRARMAEPISRNAPCPCGSGKKFKHCHGQLA